MDDGVGVYQDSMRVWSDFLRGGCGDGGFARWGGRDPGCDVMR